MSRPPEATRPPVTVVICAYTPERLEALTAGATATVGQLSAGDELLIVIDHNEPLLDRVRAWVLQALVEDDPQTDPEPEGEASPTPSERVGPSVRVLPNANRPGLSGARNTGVAAARGELVVFLDDDAVPRPGWLTQLTDPFCEPDVIGAGGVALPAWESSSPGWMPEEFLWVVGCSYKGLPRQPVQIRNPIGANMAFRRSVIQTAGGFADGLGRVGRTPLGCEETEFSIRAARLTGGRIVQQPSAAVDHLVTDERLRPRYFLHRCWAEGISKAIVSRLAGSDAALASERHYTTRTLPAGVGAGLLAGLTGDVAGFKRAAAIVVGLIVTVAGYLRGSVSRLRLSPAAPPLSPETVSPSPAAPTLSPETASPSPETSPSPEAAS